MGVVSLHPGDCAAILPTFAGDSIDAVVCDPPAGIAFMSKSFDTFKGRSHFIAYLTPILAECLRVAKPGAHLLCWSLPRTSHWTGTAIEDAGWQIEDRIAHLFGSGFPKHKYKLKPAIEDWWLATKPGPKWLGVEATRIGTEGTLRAANGVRDGVAMNCAGDGSLNHARVNGSASGRWPADVCLTHHQMCMCNGECVEGCPARLLGEQGGESRSVAGFRGIRQRHDAGDQSNARPKPGTNTLRGHSDSGTAARFYANFEPDRDHDPFFYCPKASRSERNHGCEGLEEVVRPITCGHGLGPVNTSKGGDGIRENRPTANHHPTVKPIALMRWLCRLACPEGGTILDPFAGSGSTGVAAIAEGFGFVGIERDPAYFEIMRRRVEGERAKTPLFS